MHLPLLQVDAYWRTLVVTLLASGIKAFSSACGCAGRTFALRAQNDITPRGDALWKQQRSILLISISLSSIKGLTKRVSVFRLVQNDGSVPMCGHSVFINLRLPPILATICGRTAARPRVSIRRVMFGRRRIASMQSFGLHVGTMG